MSVLQTKSTVRVFVRLRPVIHQEGQEPEETCLRAINHNKVEVGKFDILKSGP